MHQRIERALHVEIVAAKGIDTRDGSGRRIAIHDVGAAVVVRPAIPYAVVLRGLVEQALGDVAADLRIQPGHQR